MRFPHISSMTSLHPRPGNCVFGVLKPMQRKRYDLRAVVCMQLEHDVPDMHFDRALAHMEFVGDGLVPLTLPKALQNLNLARREPVCAPVVLGMHGVFSISKGHCHPP